MRINIVLNALGAILKYIGLVLLLPVIFAIATREYIHIIPFLICSFASIFLGFLFRLRMVEETELRKNEALFVVFFTWSLFGLICSIPYLFYGINFINALFEGVSGVTTTGATIITNYSLYPKTFFFFRALTQWLGGMGIIVLFMAVLPKFAVAGRQMFTAELPGPNDEKFTPRVRQTALWLWGIYIGLTIIQTLVLIFIGKMDFYNAICYSFATISTGGFAHHATNVAFFNSNIISWIVIIFMFASGCSFALLYKTFIQRKITELTKNSEFWTYTSIIFITSAIIFFIISQNNPNIFGNLTNAIFMTISTITTTGFNTVNYNLWNIDARILLFALMFVGGCAASTSGGIKVVRWMYIFKYLKKEIVKIVHPNAVYPIKIGGKTVEDDVRIQFVAFVIFYMAIFAFSSFLVGLIEDNATIAITGSISTLGNVGVSFGNNFNGFYDLNIMTKIIFIFNMIVGRLELIPFLALLHIDGWKKI